MIQQSHYWDIPEKTTIQKDTCATIHSSTIYNSQQPRCSSAKEWMRKSWHKYVIEYSVQLSRSVVSNSLRPHESQHARPPRPSPTPGVHSDSHPSSQWCHPAISSSVVPFSSCPQSFPASASFPMSQLFAWGGQSTGVSYYSAIKRNKFESIVVRYMNLETVIQNEISQKEKNKYYILTHIYGI